MKKTLLCFISGLLAAFAVEARQFDKANTNMDVSENCDAVIQKIQNANVLSLMLTREDPQLQEEISNAEEKIILYKADIALKKAILDIRKKQGGYANDSEQIKTLAKAKFLEENNNSPAKQQSEKPFTESFADQAPQ